jgi:hypothetical protein
MGGKSRKMGGVSKILINKILEISKTSGRENPPASLIKEMLIKPDLYGEENKTMLPTVKKPLPKKRSK